MQEYTSKQELVDAINKAANAFIVEFEGIADADKNVLIEGVDRSPLQMLAYQLGWMQLLRSWDASELAGEEVITPAPGIKWNQMGVLYDDFTQRYQEYGMAQLIDAFKQEVESLTTWLTGFSDEELFQPGGRKWASSTPSNWPIYKWVHINTVAPFQSFRSKIRKWKKLKQQA
jgi:hypothetical protein